ncbi:hypothetical protein HKX48_007951 [Thoreauomyces humboldtii]|nr:hypothetical protein HKX48_007951 [Thoreauomyces humboldtii]
MYFVVGLTIPSSSTSEGSGELSKAPAPIRTDSLPATIQPLVQRVQDDVLLVECFSEYPEQDVLAAFVSASGEQNCEAETYVSGPCRIPIRRWTIDDLTDRTGLAERFQESGLASYRRAVSEDDIDMLYTTTMERIAEAHRLLELGKPEINVGKEPFAFAELGSRGNNRFDLILPSTTTLDRVIQTAPWTDLVRSHLRIPTDTRPKCLPSVVYSLPGAPDQSWHADGPPARDAASPYAICVFVPLIPLTRETGCTQFWPGSHTSRALLGFGPAAEVCGATVDGMVGSGDAVVYDYGLMHRGLENASTLVRPVLQMVYHVDGWKDTTNYGEERLFPEAA